MLPIELYDGDAAEQGHAADRFAREIAGILKPSCAARSRQLMPKPLGRHLSRILRTECLKSGALSSN